MTSDSIITDITDMNTNGEGIGHTGGYTLFIKGAVPGDTVRARITGRRKNYGFAETEAVITPSPDRVTPACPVSDSCGGCTLQSLDYAAQLRFKKKLVEDNLTRIGGLEDLPPVNEVIGMETPFRYRNKAQYPVGYDEDGRLVAGFYEGKSHRIVRADDCLLSPETDRAIVRTVLTFMELKKIRAYDEKTGRGLVRHILIRTGFTTGEIMVCLIINGRHFPEAPALAALLRSQVTDRIVSVCLNVNIARNNVILGREVLPVYGEPCLYDDIGSLRFRISPLSFYQVNPIQTVRLYDTVKRMAALTGTETVLDLYCGIGTIGLYLAEGARRVLGVEIVPEAIRDAADNAAANGITNAVFSVGASEDIFRDLPDSDVVVLDPPRKGCEASLLEELITRAPSRIVYVSCNPSTLARDLRILTRAYAVEEIQPCDMFPHTGHVETVCLLSRNK